MYRVSTVPRMHSSFGGESPYSKGAPSSGALHVVHRLATAEVRLANVGEITAGDGEILPKDSVGVGADGEVQVVRVRRAAPRGCAAAAHRAATPPLQALIAWAPGTASASRPGAAGVLREAPGREVPAAMATEVSGHILAAAVGRSCVPRSRTCPALPAPIHTARPSHVTLNDTCELPNRPTRNVTAHAKAGALRMQDGETVTKVHMVGTGAGWGGAGRGRTQESTSEGRMVAASRGDGTVVVTALDIPTVALAMLRVPEPPSRATIAAVGGGGRTSAAMCSIA